MQLSFTVTCAEVQQVSDSVQVRATFPRLPLDQLQLCLYHQQLSTSDGTPWSNIYRERGENKNRVSCTTVYSVCVCVYSTYWPGAWSLLASLRASRHWSLASLTAPQLLLTATILTEQFNRSESSCHFTNRLSPAGGATDKENICNSR